LIIVPFSGRQSRPAVLEVTPTRRGLPPAEAGGLRRSPDKVTGSVGGGEHARCLDDLDRPLVAAPP